MIKVIIEIEGQQLKFAATTLNIENSDVYLTIAEGEKIKCPSPNITAPVLKNKISKKQNGLNIHALKGKPAITKIKICPECGKEYKPTSNGQKRCAECREKKK